MTSCILAGLLFFGTDIFDAQSPLFQISAYGIIGAASIILFILKRFRDAFFVLLILFLLDMFIFGFNFMLTRSINFLCMIGAASEFSAYLTGKIRKT